jgi:hypothetical protein
MMGLEDVVVRVPCHHFSQESLVWEFVAVSTDPCNAIAVLQAPDPYRDEENSESWMRPGSGSTEPR